MTLPDSGAPLPRRPAPPALNVPGVVTAMILALLAVHAVRVFLLDPYQEVWTLLNFSFIPGCYEAEDAVCTTREPGAGLWSPLTYALLHGDWAHVGFNAIWLLAFGTPVAKRLGPLRTLLFCAAGSMAGAAVFELVNSGLLVPVIGASGLVSALMGGASRFALGAPGRRGGAGMIDARRPLLPMTEVLRERTVVIFVAVFFATNLIVGAGAGGIFGAEGAVAWEAHLGGFAFGFLFFGFFDRGPRRMARAPLV